MNTSIDIEKKKRTELFVTVVLFLLVFFSAMRIPFDTDLFWHLNAGNQTLELRSPVLVDLFSYTRFGTIWINHSWLSQVIFSIVFRLFSFSGLMIFSALLSTATMFLLFRQMQANVFVKAFLIILAMLVVAPVWSPRPQLFTLLLLAILIGALQKFLKTGNRYILAGLLLLFILWSNLHAGFSVGIAYLGLFFVGAIIDWGFKENREKFRHTNILPLFFLLFFSILVVCINPNGIKVWTVQLNTLSIQVLQQYIDEWSSPNFHELAQQPYLWTWLLFVFLISMTAKKIALRNVFPLVFFGALGFISKRNFAPFALVVFPIISDLSSHLATCLSQEFSTLTTFDTFRRINNVEPKVIIQKSINIFIVVLAMLAVFIKGVYLGHPVVLNAYEQKLFPQAAMKYLEEVGTPAGNVLNSYAWGGYQNWKNADMRVMVDGRTDIYGDEILLDWIQMVKADTGWQEEFRQYDIKWTFLEIDSPVNQYLMDSGWNVFYQDSLALILTKP